MNIFEGARRIAKVIAGVVILGTVIAAFLDKPHLSYRFAFDEDNQLQRVDSCFDPSIWFYAQAVGRPDISVIVCGYTSGPDHVQLSNSDIVAVDDALAEKRMYEIGYKLGALGGLLLLGWAFVWATGWIVRGFMGIPRGSDKK